MNNLFSLTVRGCERSVYRWHQRWCQRLRGKQDIQYKRNEIALPGVAGHAGADDHVEHSEGDEPLMEPSVHPLVWENVRRVADGWTCGTRVRKSDNGHHPRGFRCAARTQSLLSEATRTEAVQTEGAVVEEEADVACTRRHAAEGVGAAGRQGVHATGEQENDQRPGEGVLPCCLSQNHCHQFPQEIPAGEGPQEVYRRILYTHTANY